MSLSTSGPATWGSGHTRPRPWTEAEDAKLRAAIADGPMRGRAMALADELGRSFYAINYRITVLRKLMRAEAAGVVTPGRTLRPSQAGAHHKPSQAQLHRAELPRPEEVTRRCVACRGRFLAPSRFVFRCEPCLKMHASWTGYDA